ncbi:PREDICTED: uncharacterized protein LOC105559902 [Vollenhovia emeryi]|uniref:uncharacterized protein LOC105559902 n=1 Tax=Vollenhovia emeryi TaxID=411798 RepID=UPI0005F3F95D|nr:PREDICTED: uncharacterized protein LOC105559902 [Vollenhovia emeryi]
MTGNKKKEKEQTKSKKKKSKHHQFRYKYDQKNVINGLKALERGVSSREAAAQFGIPRSTLYKKFTKARPVEARKGPATILTTEEEDLLCQWVLFCSESGYPVTKAMLLTSVQKLVKELDRKTPFKNNKPGRHWYDGFCRRHPQITTRVSQNLVTSRADVSVEALEKWFADVKEYLLSIDMFNQHPSRYFNLDESAFFLVPRGDLVLARRGAQTVYKVVNGDEKENLTTLFTISGDGRLLPPMVLYWYQRIPERIMERLPPDWIVGTTDSGWMTESMFFKYVTQKFYPWLLENLIEFPVVLFIDGHASHISVRLAEFCKQYKIELVALYPNATHILQPLDVAVFHPLKT